MKTTALNLVLLDDNTLMANPLSNYLNNRFGSRVRISAFYDVERCLRGIAEDAHVIVLDYLVNGKVSKTGLEKFNYIKKISPQTDVTLITSDEDAAGATEEMQRETSEYIMNREGYSRNIVHHINRKVVAPLRVFTTYPFRKIIYFYTVKNYLMMFVVAFVSVGILVLAALLAVNLFSNG